MNKTNSIENVEKEKNIQNDKSKIQFDINQLSNFSFGKLEGERDPFLKDCFFPTKSVQKYLKETHNYVLSPKGAGKSALFRALTDNFLVDYFFDYSKYSIIPINEAFGFDDDYLDIKKFKEDSRMKMTISWALFLLTSIINDIKNNHSEKLGYENLIDEIKSVSELKEKFNLYDLTDLLKSIEAAIEFTANGQEFSVAPKVKISKRKKKLVLNDIFKSINKFYKQNDLTALILIDRLDNFVQKEAYSLQRKYIQGLFDCIEEMSLFSNINPTVFLRTDLFYSYESDLEYDKTTDRTIELKWENGETLNFVVNRLMNNDYISENYSDYILNFIKEANEGKHREFKKPKQNLWNKIISKINKKRAPKLELDTSKPLNYTVSDRFLKIFFPDIIIMENGDENEFCEWIFEYLKDANLFVNPRLLINFFNRLIENQNDYNGKFYPDKNPILKPLNNGNNPKFDLICNDVFKQTFENIQQEMLKNTYTILKKKEFQIIFKLINSRSYSTGIFKYGDFNIKQLGIEKEDYESCLKYLKLLGYCFEYDKQKFAIPTLFRQYFELT